MPQKSPLSPAWRRPLAAGILLLVCSVASAQWVWKEGERKVFSDTAPPASVPEQNIIKRPGSGGSVSRSAPVAPPASAEPSAAPQLPTVDKELEARKKQTQQTEEAQKKAEDQRIAKARAEDCARAKQAKTTLDSGVRLSTTNAKGEREVMDDKARAAESKRLDEVARNNCGPLPKPAAQ